MGRLFSVGMLFVVLSSSQSLASYSLCGPEKAETPTSWLQRLSGPRSASIRYDKRMIAAAEIAAARASASSRYSCWRYVKAALVEAHVIDSYPKTRYAKEAAVELRTDFGFTRLPYSDPYDAPTGSILVYGGPGPGHVEFRSAQGFVSDFISPKPANLPLIGIYVKPRC